MLRKLFVLMGVMVLCGIIVPTITAQTATPELKVGSEFIVRTPDGQPLRLRIEPDQSSEIVVNMAGEITGKILEGPIIQTREDSEFPYIWWRVRLLSGAEGWTISSLGDFETLVPYQTPVDASCTYLQPVQLEAEQEARVISDQVVILRTAPSEEAAVVNQMPGRAVFSVIDGPICGVEKQYWMVEYNDQRGWIPEVDAEKYLLEPYDSTDTEKEDTTCLGALDQEITVGMRIEATTRQRTRANNPTNTGIDDIELFPGNIVTVIGGPLCFPVEERNASWWLIETERGSTVWAAEGGAAAYYLKPSVLPTVTPTRTPFPTATFTPTLSADAACTLITRFGVNLRQGPGESYPQAGSRAANDTLNADGQFDGNDGFIWWRSDTGEWIREDLVLESEDCAHFPVVTAPPIPEIGPSPTLNPNAVCLVTTLQGVNFRGTPSTDGEQIGSALADTVIQADGQFNGADGFIWWRLVDDQGWVRQDLVSESDTCSTLPVVEP